jgi:hypothetical protein
MKTVKIAVAMNIPVAAKERFDIRAIPHTP